MWKKASITKKFVLPCPVKTSTFIFLKIPLDTPNLLTIFSFRKFNNYSWAFFADSMTGFSSLWRNITITLTEDVDDFLLQNICIHFTGIYITSRHSLLVYWAFSQHCRSLLVNLFGKVDFTYCETPNPDWSFKKKHQIAYESHPIHVCWSRQVYFARAAQYRSCLFGSFFPMIRLCKLSYSSQIVTKRKTTSCEVETKTLLHHQLRPHATAFHGTHLKYG